MTDLEIAQQASMENIAVVAGSLGLGEDDLERYGKNIAKLTDEALKKAEKMTPGKLILVTAINPTPAGEGKTTVTIGLGDALAMRGKKTAIALREPSLGPCFGIKGGAAGGGHAQAVPMEKLNLHFTGDIHAITAANNLLCAMLDNHLQQGNALGIDPDRIVVKRCLDMNDRALRNTVIGLGKRSDGVVREDHFCITVATEVMAVLCLASDLFDLRERLSRMIVAYTYENKPVTAGDLKAAGAMTVLLSDAIRPNMIQTLAHTPVFVHGGPFANIAHGCNSLRATRTALGLADYVVTEAGFGADLGAEKFLDIKCRIGGLTPSAIVLVATARALKYNGGVPKDRAAEPDMEALKRGAVNLGKHIENLKKYGVPLVVTLNHFVTDTDEEISFLRDYVESQGAAFTLARVWEKGGEGGQELAEAVEKAVNQPGSFRHLYPSELSLREKIETIAREIYGADGVDFINGTDKTIAHLEEMGYGSFPVCVAKTQYSLSDDPAKLGRPEGFRITIREVYVSAGAGFVVMIAGSVMVMPGLPRIPAAERIDIDSDGNIVGLF